MDPQACFDEYLRLIADAQVGPWDADRDDRIDELVDAYDGWRRMGGFCATWDGDDVDMFSTNGDVKLLTLLGSVWVTPEFS